MKSENSERYNEYLKLSKNFTNEATKSILEKFLVIYPNEMDNFSKRKEDHCFYCQSQLSIYENHMEEHKKQVHDLIIRMNFQQSNIIVKTTKNKTKKTELTKLEDKAEIEDKYETAHLIEKMPIGLFPTLEGVICKKCSDEFTIGVEKIIKIEEQGDKTQFKYGLAVAQYSDLLDKWIKKVK